MSMAFVATGCADESGTRFDIAEFAAPGPGGQVEFTGTLTVTEGCLTVTPGDGATSSPEANVEPVVVLFSAGLASVGDSGEVLTVGDDTFSIGDPVTLGGAGTTIKEVAGDTWPEACRDVTSEMWRATSIEASG